MKIYTRSGDDGTTGLYGGDRIEKTSERIVAIGEVDELNAVLGVARTHAEGSPLDGRLASLQSLLFDLGSELASPPGGKFVVEAVQPHHVSALEAEIDEMMERLPPLKNFILPGGSSLAASLHLARAVCRRAERTVLCLDAQDSVRRESKELLNRLSDWLFAAARSANAERGIEDVPWKRSEAS